MVIGHWSLVIGNLKFVLLSLLVAKLCYFVLSKVREIYKTFRKIVFEVKVFATAKTLTSKRNLPGFKNLAGLE
jgi:hypothetical protein